MELEFLSGLASTRRPADSIRTQTVNAAGPAVSKPYSSLEVELTTRCNLYCPSCARVVHSRTWIERDMTLDCYREIAKSFDRFELVHLRGWGGAPEKPPFFRDGRPVHATRHTPGSVDQRGHQTGPGLASLFRYDFLPPGLRTGLDLRTPESKGQVQSGHFQYQRGPSTPGVDVRPKPRVVILFSKNKYSFLELPIYLKQAIRLRPDRVVFYRPDFRVRKVDDRGRLPADLDPQLLAKVDDMLETMADSAGLDMVNQPSQAGSGASRCVFDRERGFFTDWNGRISVCRNTSLPVVGGHFSRFVKGRLETFSTGHLGSLLRQTLEEIVNTREHIALRNACRTGRVSRSGLGNRVTAMDCSPPMKADRAKLVEIRKVRAKNHCGCFGR